MIASWFRHGAAVRQLLAEDGDLNVRCEGLGTALNIAAIREDENITKMLIENNVKAYLGNKEYNILETKRSELEQDIALEGFGPFPRFRPPFRPIIPIPWWDTEEHIYPILNSMEFLVSKAFSPLTPSPTNAQCTA
jgi:hypothetical protein